MQSASASENRPQPSPLAARLPAAERSIEQLKTELRFPNPSVSQLVIAIRQEPAFVLQLLCQAAVESGEPVGRLEDAVVLVGRQQLQRIADATPRLTNRLRHTGFDTLCRDARLCGALSECIAVWRGDRDREYAYVAGLLHRLGDMMRVCNAIQPAPHMRQQKDAFASAMFDGELARSLSLPDPVIAAIRFHISPAVAREHSFLVNCVALSRMLSDALRGASNSRLRQGFTCFELVKLQFPGLSLAEHAELTDLLVSETMRSVQCRHAAINDTGDEVNDA